MSEAPVDPEAFARWLVMAREVVDCIRASDYPWAKTLIQRFDDREAEIAAVEALQEIERS